ncbi:MAG: hypothetical protein IKP33_01115 [Prevotella sp.]|nr:hypothetical protein [Prevotella sp.]
MEELKEKANSYAEENVNNVLKEAFAKVYADGYRDGYKDHEEEFAIDLQDGETEFVDLGLPSGTMWSADYRQDDYVTAYLTYEKSSLLNIPTKEEWEELMTTCEWEYEINSAFNLCKARCVGPNGNILCFERTGKMDFDTVSDDWEVYFWLRDEENEGNEKTAINIYNAGRINKSRNVRVEVETFFPGFKLPVRLVKSK